MSLSREFVVAGGWFPTPADSFVNVSDLHTYQSRLYGSAKPVPTLASRLAFPSKAGNVDLLSVLPTPLQDFYGSPEGGALQQSVDRYEAVASLTLSIIDSGLCSGKALMDLVGKWTWACWW